MDEENLLNRLDKIIAESGALLPLSTDLRTIIYLSDQAEARYQKRLKQQQQAQQFSL